ncbi:MAG: hypothetical protein H6878_02310 [Rhodobiaceae bacterium]|nr:hypothetical protein [Rhodobiaceae bacterium]MCC0015120.1 hypothetical protein [Rhodobiaceae bacterium]MCC0040815.1 hypothetical protein [Rhodobiaceae bacterium]MCC0053641.1 hypothetical protein [Rhodobiaceae bacterium]
MRAMLLALATLAVFGAGEVRAQDFSGQWTCSYASMNYNTGNRIERSYTMVLYPNGTYEAVGTHVASLIGIYERWGSQGQWQIGGLGDGQPYVQAGGPANFSSGRNEQFLFWGWIKGPNLLESDYSQQGYQNQTSCAR